MLSNLGKQDIEEAEQYAGSVVAGSGHATLGSARRLACEQENILP